MLGVPELTLDSTCPSKRFILHKSRPFNRPSPRLRKVRTRYSLRLSMHLADPVPSSFSETFLYAEIDRALRMLAQYDSASGGGAGAYGLAGEGGSLDMIDAPMVSYRSDPALYALSLRRAGS